MTRRLRLALPAGTLLPGACELLDEAGLATLRPEDLDRTLTVDAGEVSVIRVRPIDVPVYVELGAADAGIVGKDVLWETHRDLYELLDLRVGHCRLVLAAPAGSRLARDDWPPSLRVATKYPRAARSFFDRINVSAELIKLYGSVEIAPATGLADAVLDITATGTTLRANALVEVAEAARSTARLIVNHASLKVRAAEIDAVARALRGAVERRTAAHAERA